jgi:hypothetical protein
MERERVEVSPEELLDFYDRLGSVITGLPADSILNLDEAGYQEWADRTDVKVVVPDNFPDDTVDVSYNRHDARSWILKVFLPWSEPTVKNSLFEVGLFCCLIAALAIVLMERWMNARRKGFC